MSRYQLVKFTFIALFISTVGCQPSQNRPDNLPELFPMAVTVVQEGTPVAGAFVRFIPEDTQMPWSCGGTTSASGVAVIRTLGEFDGAPAGSYKVVVSKLEMPPVVETDLANLDASAPKPADSFDLIGPPFSLPNKTPLEITVSKENSKQEFEVGPAVRIKRQGPR